MPNAKSYRNATEQLMEMQEAIDKHDRNAFLIAMRPNPNNWIVGDATLSEMYVKVYRKALTTFITADAE